jgi:hypothetical protein
MGQTQNDKKPEDNVAPIEEVPPPTYTPREIPATPVTPIHPPPPHPRTYTPDNNVRVLAPRPPFASNLAEIGPEPANVVCPRCHYGVTTSVKSSIGSHAAYILKRK